MNTEEPEADMNNEFNRENFERLLIENEELKKKLADSNSEEEADSFVNALYSTAEDKNSREENIATGEQHLRLVFENAGVGLIITNSQGKLIGVNPAFARMLNYSVHELMQMSFQELTHPEDLAREIFLVEQILSNQRESYQIEKRYLRRDNSIIWLRMTVSVNRAVDRSISYIIGVAEDITSKRAAEEELKRNREFLKKIINVNPNLIFVKNQNGEYIMANEALASAYGVKVEDILHKTDQAFDLDKDQIQHIKETDLKVLENRETVIIEEEPLTFPGQGIRYFKTVKVPIYAGPEDEDCVLVVSSDITERKQKQKELEESRKEAESATLAKSRFLANMSHEIRTPMNSIIGMASLLVDTSLDDDQYDFVETIRNNGEALIALINDILDFSKIEAGMMQLEEHAFRLHEVIENTVMVFAFKAMQKQLEYTLFIDPDIPEQIFADSTRLRQIMANLISNAVKFTGSGGIHTRIEKIPGEEKGSFSIRFSVTDTGPGIAPERQEQIFDSFSQADASITRQFGGTGLGLSISKSLLELMGSELRLVSELNHGSTFSFDIYQKNEKLPDQSATLAAIDLTGKSYLIYDRFSSNGDIIAEYLKFCKAEVKTVLNENDFCLALKKEKFTSAFLFTGYNSAAELKIIQEQAGSDCLEKGDNTIALFNPAGSELQASKRTHFSGVYHTPLKISDLPRILSAENISRTKAKVETIVNQQKTDIQILLAEDNTDNQNLIIHFLKKIGLTCDIADNGEISVEMAQKKEYDIILMDVQMPVMDGLTATRKILENASTGDNKTPVIVALTANAMVEDREACYQAGMKFYLSKPLRPALFSQTITDIITGVTSKTD